MQQRGAPGDLPGIDAAERGLREHRRAERAERDARGMPDQGQRHRLHRRVAQADEDRRSQRHWRAEAGRALEEQGEQPADQQRLQRRPRGQPRQRVAQGGDRPAALLQVVQGQRRPQDPQDRQREEAALGGHTDAVAPATGGVGGAAEAEDPQGQHDGQRQPGAAGACGRPLPAQHQREDQRNRRGRQRGRGGDAVHPVRRPARSTPGAAAGLRRRRCRGWPASCARCRSARRR